MNINYTVKERFLRYVQIDSQANPVSDRVPSTAKQLNMTNQLAAELTDMHIQFEQTEHGYIYATIPSNSTKQQVPTIFFCAHVDTAPDASGTNVKPIVHENYQGKPIYFPDDDSLVLNQENFPELSNYIGHDIITASGKTLLGADDKSGVAAIMDAAYQLTQQPTLKHGKIMLFFTTDEEIGRGVDHVDLKKLNCEYGYTLDSGPIGHLENENFSANAAVLIVEGVAAHPGYAKGKMENAIKIAAEIVAALPKERLSPESTTGREGFIHPGKIEGELEKATVQFILRDFDTQKLSDHLAVIKSITDETLKKYPNSTATLHAKEQYRNMIDYVGKHPEIIDIAMEAMENVGVKPHLGIIRGGTDGAMLSSKDLPCPNLFSGQHGIHSKLEWTTVQEMQKAVDTIIEICRLTEEKA